MYLIFIIEVGIKNRQTLRPNYSLIWPHNYDWYIGIFLSFSIDKEENFSIKSKINVIYDE